MNKTNIPSGQKILDSISQSVIVVDLDGNVMLWNQASEEIFGYSKGEMIGRPLSNIYPDFAKEKLEKDLKKLKKGEEIRGQWRSLTKNNGVIWIDLKTKALKNKEGKTVAVVATACNIQQLKEVEKELEQNKVKAQAILETTVDGIVTSDEDGKILSFNQAASDIFGYTEEEVIGKKVNMLMPEPHASEHDKHLKRYVETGEKRVIGERRELTGKRKDGSIFPIELSVTEVKWDNSQLFTAVINDITERRRLEQEILRVSEEARKRLGQDLHDGLGQMLTGIGLISQNLARKLKSNAIPGADEVQEISDMIKEADEYAKSLAHGLIHVDVEEGINPALSQLCQQAQKVFKVNCNYNSNFKSDIFNSMTKTNLYRIAQEAISNAVKHGKAENINVMLSAEKSMLRLEVVDDGVGFSKSANRNPKKGMGIRIMGYRSNVMSGNLTIEERGNKTHIICSIPTDNI